MNIFFLHRNPKICVKWYVDRHVVKMILEYMQLLCTAICVTDRDAITPVKPTHKNHPCAIWARKSKNNWLYLRKLALELCKEYTYRYQKHHKYEEDLKTLDVPDLPDLPLCDPPQCMPDEYKCDNAVLAYRNLYILGKSHLHFWKTRHAWKNREIPQFINDVLGY